MAIKLGISHCVRDFRVSQTTEWQRIGNEINAEMIFARADFLNVRFGRRLHRRVGPHNR
jgi:hypothetical protein